MKIDHSFALIELTAEEAEQYKNNAEYKNSINRKAADLSDETQRTVEIYDDQGNVLDTVSNY